MSIADLFPQPGDRVLVKKIKSPEFFLTKPEPGTVVQIVHKDHRQSVYRVKLDRDRRIDDTWQVYFFDCVLI